jgi:hypothetical protein
VQCSATDLIHVATRGRLWYGYPSGLHRLADATEFRAEFQRFIHTADGMLNSITAIWLGCGILAVFMLVKMMRRRQLYLIDLLKAHVEIQAAWARRRDRALEIAAAEQAETERQKAKVVKIVNEITSQSEAA